MALGMTVQRIGIERGLDQNQVAHSAGIGRPTCPRLERSDTAEGQSANLSRRNVMAVAQARGVEVEELLPTKRLDLRERKLLSMPQTEKRGAHMGGDFRPVATTVGERSKHLGWLISQTAFAKRGWGLAAGGVQTMALWSATADAYVTGNWVGTVLCAQAVCEQMLAHLVSLRELPGASGSVRADKNWEKKALGWFIERAREDQSLPSTLLDDIKTVCDRRIVLVHFRRPFEPGTLDRRVMEAMKKGHEGDGDEIRTELLADDALHAVKVAMELCFGDHTLNIVPGS